jgi:molybdopterin molybdotransferase
MSKSLLSVEQAEATIMAGLPDSGTESVPLDKAVGRVLRQAVSAERDQPPFHRVTMDGIAIAHSEWAGGRRVFPIQGVQAAGAAQSALGGPANCIEVMTGAVLPEGCDTVIPVELIDCHGGQASLSEGCEPARGQYVHRRGSDYRQGASLLQPGVTISLTEIAVLAACGLAEVRVSSMPAITVVSTGDELVEVGEPISPHQIRQSNSHAILAALAAAGHAQCRYLHLKDDPDSLHASLVRAQRDSDVLILSGGVSKGKFDFVPGVLEQLGVQKLFHRVAQRPGKPMWFGRDAKGTLVFALPGNPVSTLVCLHRYVIPALQACQRANPPRVWTTRLNSTFSPGASLTCFMPAAVRCDSAGQLHGTLRPTNTSGDFASLAGTDGFVELPAGQERFEAGYCARFFAWAGRP